MGGRKGWHKLLPGPEQDEARAYYCLAGCGARLARREPGYELRPMPPSGLGELSPTSNLQWFRVRLELGFRLYPDGRYHRSKNEADRARNSRSQRMIRMLRMAPRRRSKNQPSFQPSRPMKYLVDPDPAVKLQPGAVAAVVCPKCGAENSIGDPV